ncbi:MAG: NAD-dependent epimerase/dehydratase family protein [Saprospiraceae bacterium]|jgi:dihydroflavonol-4-reductase
MNKNILVTGATGLVGSYVVRTLIANGYTNVTIIHRATSNMALLEDVKDKIKYFEADLTDVFGLEDAFEGITHVIHCGALVSFDSRDKRALAKTNIEGTANLVNLAIENNIQKLIYIGSIASLGRNTNDDMIHEDVKFEDSPSNSFYAITKNFGEMEVWRGKAEGLDVKVLIPGLILGSGFWKVGTNGFFNHVWRGSKFYPEGTTGFVDVRDIADFALRMLDYEGPQEKFLMIGKNVSYKVFLETIASAFKKNAPSIPTKKWILAIAWRLDKLRSFVTGSRPMLTKETATTSSKLYLFDNSRSLEIEGFEYIPFEQTIAETAAQYMEASLEQFIPKVLKVKQL